jgi:hypothetical protein
MFFYKKRHLGESLGITCNIAQSTAIGHSVAQLQPLTRLTKAINGNRPVSCVELIDS